MSAHKLSDVIIKGLQSNEEKHIVEAIKSIRKFSNSGYFPYVLKLLDKQQPEAVIKEISSLLNDCKDKDATVFIVDAIKNLKYKKYLHLLVSSCWISNNDFSKHPLVFTEVVLKEDYQVAFEALTVIEDILCNISDKDKELCLDRLNSEIENVNSDKRQMVGELVKIIENY
jgi:hypothetical protein